MIISSKYSFCKCENKQTNKQTNKKNNGKLEMSFHLLLETSIHAYSHIQSVKQSLLNRKHLVYLHNLWNGYHTQIFLKFAYIFEGILEAVIVKSMSNEICLAYIFSSIQFGRFFYSKLRLFILWKAPVKYQILNETTL